MDGCTTGSCPPSSSCLKTWCRKDGNSPWFFAHLGATYLVCWGLYSELWMKGRIPCSLIFQTSAWVASVPYEPYAEPYEADMYNKASSFQRMIYSPLFIQLFAQSILLLSCLGPVSPFYYSFLFMLLHKMLSKVQVERFMSTLSRSLKSLSHLRRLSHCLTFK